MVEITIETERIVDKYLMSDKLIVITNPNHKIWYCEKISENDFIELCDDIKNQRIITLKLKDKNV